MARSYPNYSVGWTILFRDMLPASEKLQELVRWAHREARRIHDHPDRKRELSRIFRLESKCKSERQKRRDAKARR